MKRELEIVQKQIREQEAKLEMLKQRECDLLQDLEYEHYHQQAMPDGQAAMLEEHALVDEYEAKLQDGEFSPEMYHYMCYR